MLGDNAQSELFELTGIRARGRGKEGLSRASNVVVGPSSLRVSMGLILVGLGSSSSFRQGAPTGISQGVGVEAAGIVISEDVVTSCWLPKGGVKKDGEPGRCMAGAVEALVSTSSMRPELISISGCSFPQSHFVHAGITLTTSVGKVYPFADDALAAGDLANGEGTDVEGGSCEAEGALNTDVVVSNSCS